MVRVPASAATRKISAWLEDEHLSRRGLSFCLGITSDHLEAILKGQQPITTALAARIAELSHLTAEELLPERNGNP